MGSIIRRNGTYYIRYEGERGPDGERKQVMRSCKGMTYKQCQQLLREIETRRAHGDVVETTPITLREYCTQWLAHAKGTVAITTWHTYESTLRVHVIPMLGHLQLVKVRPLDVQKLYTQMATNGAAPKTVRNVHNLLHRLFAQAKKWRLRAANPIESVEPPKVVRREMTIPTRDIARTILCVLYPREWYLPAVISYLTGMRRAEVLGLQWQDYDAEAGTLAIRRAVTRIRDTQIVVKSTKSNRPRVVVIGRKLRYLLDKHRRLTAHDRPTDWICAKSDGGYLAPGGLSHAWRRAAEKVNAPRRFHGLRHLHATALLGAGAPSKAVAERLGHSTVQITNDLYGHVTQTIQQQAAAIAEREL